MEVSISGAILASLCTLDTTILPSKGFLLGNIFTSTETTISDSNEECPLSKLTRIQITHYLSTPDLHSYDLDENKDSKRVLGLYTVRKNIISNPSFQECRAALQILSSSFPIFSEVVILILNFPKGKDSWTSSMKYSCYTITSHSLLPQLTEISIATLSGSSASKYSTEGLSFSDGKEYTSASTHTLQRTLLAQTMQQTIATELYANSVLSDIQVQQLM